MFVLDNNHYDLSARFQNHFLCSMTQNSQQGWRNRNRQICSSDIQKHNLGKIGFVSFGS